MSLAYRREGKERETTTKERDKLTKRKHKRDEAGIVRVKPYKQVTAEKEMNTTKGKQKKKEKKRKKRQEKKRGHNENSTMTRCGEMFTEDRKRETNGLSFWSVDGRNER